MRVLMLSKACIVGIYQRKLEIIAEAPDIELMAVVPPSWRDERGVTLLERLYTTGYDLTVTPLRFNGNYHLHHYPQFSNHLHDFKPDLVHIDEEPYNLATWLALQAAQRYGSKTLFFSWQNINRRYPFPFNLIETQVLRNVDFAIMGTDSAAHVWRDKGYTGPLDIVPQFGVDTALFFPASTDDKTSETINIGYVGRLWHGKGIDTLITALSQLQHSNWHLHIIGSGPEEANIYNQLAQYQLTGNTTLTHWVPSVEMPARMRALDILVLPSRTLKSWKEQYGRVLIEAMASGVVVVGSDSGAIPDVIGSAGRVFREDDVDHLKEQLEILLSDEAFRKQLARQGIERALSDFTQQKIANKTIQIYRRITQN